jgi:hypothetical protein
MKHRQTRLSSHGRLLGGGIAAAFVLTATGVAFQWQWPANPVANPPVAAIAPPSRNALPPVRTSLIAASGDAEPASPEHSALAEQLVGVWKLQRHGERTLHLNADGTATAEVTLNMIGALMYGERMTLQLNWTLDAGVMTQTITSGTPPEAVNRLIRDWGDRREYRVIEVNDEQLVLSEVGDDGGGDREVWTSVTSTSSSTASQTKQSPR